MNVAFLLTLLDPDEGPAQAEGNREPFPKISSQLHQLLMTKTFINSFCTFFAKAWGEILTKSLETPLDFPENFQISHALF